MGDTVQQEIPVSNGIVSPILIVWIPLAILLGILLVKW